MPNSIVNEHLLIKNQFKNDSIKQMAEDIKYIDKIDKCTNNFYFIFNPIKDKTFFFY